MKNAIALVLIFLTLAFTGGVQAGPIGEIKATLTIRDAAVVAEPQRMAAE